ncbi:MAG TPA: XRE family transcriptional regulator [Pseudonocardiaceae bacterium]|nr:XRE family transcriptional regulator [Pseudonocardiaceae bacterium]
MSRWPHPVPRAWPWPGVTVTASSAYSPPGPEEPRALISDLTGSEQQWLRVRDYLREHRYDLAVSAARDYPESATVAGTPLLSTSGWLPAAPIPLDDIKLHYTPEAAFGGITGTEPVVRRLLPVRASGARYRSYSGAVAALAAPRVFENRATYRLLHAELTSAPHMVFGAGSYFDGIDVGDAVAHEFTAVHLGEITTLDLRNAIGDPCDPARRTANVALSTLTLRHDRAMGMATFPLHRRDGATVGHAGGLYQVLPVGVFQPAGEELWNAGNDFSLWRNILRELAEELRGETEDYGTHRGPIDYRAWPFASHLTQALDTGQAHAFCLGIGVDPLTFATDILTTVTIDAPLYDELFGQVTGTNAEGSILLAVPFTAETVQRYASREPTQAAGAGLLRLAWWHRSILLN